MDREKLIIRGRHHGVLIDESYDDTEARNLLIDELLLPYVFNTIPTTPKSERLLGELYGKEELEALNEFLADLELDPTSAEEMLLNQIKRHTSRIFAALIRNRHSSNQENKEN